MRDRTFHTSINLLIEAGLYQRLRWAAKQTKTGMSKIVREGIKIIMAQIEKEIDIVMGGHK
jgi:predicted DNA-binding protein